MKDYKIKVANEAESKEAQELLFGLGYVWSNNRKEYYKLLEDHFIVTFSDGVILQALLDRYNTDHEEYQEITLPQLRDLVVLHRNDVSDATHIGKDDRYGLELGGQYYIYHDDVKKWRIVSETYFTNLAIKPINEPQMTWQDALRAVADGKEVEFHNVFAEEWQNINDLQISLVVESKVKFRLAPQRKELNGNFTKEELLKIAGEMARLI